MRSSLSGMSNLVLATRNEHKVAELRAMLGDVLEVKTLSDFADAPQLPETADSFAGNASQKALALAQWLGGLPENDFPAHARSHCLVASDDSGLEVDALDGAPGVHSARYASADGGNASDADNNIKLLREMENVPLEKRSARFVCVIAVTKVVRREDTSGARLFEGTCEGTITTVPHGENGFGYDPLFIPSGHWQTFAELGAEVKNQLSHRAVAFSKMASWLRESVL